MTARFSKSAIKFIEKANKKDRDRLRQRIKSLLLAIEEHGAIPFRDMDIKKLSGEWSGFFRMRVGKIRVIFGIDNQKGELAIYEIDYRGDIYKG